MRKEEVKHGDTQAFEAATMPAGQLPRRTVDMQPRGCLNEKSSQEVA
jgi:hypothetical protein